MAPDTLLQQSHPLRADFFEKEGELLGATGARRAKAAGDVHRLFRQPRHPGAADRRAARRPVRAAEHCQHHPAVWHRARKRRRGARVRRQSPQSRHVVICGHTDCGGIKALDGQIDPLAEQSLRHGLSLRERRRRAPMGMASSRTSATARLSNKTSSCSWSTQQAIQPCARRWTNTGSNCTAGCTTCMGRSSILTISRHGNSNPHDQLLLIRHGQSTWNAEGRIQGWADPPLDEDRA